uniref:FAS1 n=1 Tax=Vuralia turcica TaxID=1177745 RepID=A0A7D5HHQ9_9FABA|nr:FAS1 [Vuralia turcica]
MEMADAVINDVVVVEASPKSNGDVCSKPTRKRKKSTITTSSLKNLSAEEKVARVESLRKELEALFGYYREVMNQKVIIEVSDCGSRNAAIAALMEESELPLSRLVYDIYEKLKVAALVEPVTCASVKSSVLSVGQRMAYGVPNSEADVLEDHSESCFWCWETRDVKLIPKSVRGQLIVRRTCRKKIHERIIAVSEMIASLEKLESDQNYNHFLIKASAKLGKANTEADIRLLVDGLLQKNIQQMAKKKVNREDKLLVKQLDGNIREVKKEKESTHSELQTETLPNESDLKLLQDETRNDEKCHEKIGCEKRKLQKKQPEDTEKVQRRREKEEAEFKRKRCLQKQASIMERFLKRSKTNPSVQNDEVSTKSIASDSSSSKSESVSASATLSMDCTLASSTDITLEDVRKSHFSLWRNLGQSIRSNRKQGWGLRRKPRTELFKQLKLTANKDVVHYDELSMEMHVDKLEEQSSDNRSSPISADSSLDAKKCCRGKQLFQFDKSHRPAFYGIWSTRSHVVGPRHPFRKEPSLDYDVSSDEEWEEEDPGESLSDCDKDEEECPDPEECSKSDGESEDGFFVPDGYLSEDEGAQVDRMKKDIDFEGADSSPSCKDDIESEEFCTLLRQQKYLNNLTEQALRKNQPLLITNLIHDKEFLLLGHNLSGTPKLEQMYLQALSMCMIPGSTHIEISIDKMQDEDREAFLSTGKGGATPISDVAAIPESDLPIIVTTIQNSSEGMNKLLCSLQQKFPSASKSLLRNKVREVSDYVDNRLQVKKEVLIKLGLAVNSEKSSKRPRSIAAFFSKRCLPPSGESVKPGETSPLPSLKSYSADHE